MDLRLTEPVPLGKSPLCLERGVIAENPFWTLEV